MTTAALGASGATLALLANRGAGTTICPSEVARVLGAAADAGAEEWRTMMPAVHAAVDHLVAEGRVRLSWKGQALASRNGPYRIGGGGQTCSNGDDHGG